MFESAIVPNWKDGKIRLMNVSVKRLPKLEYPIPISVVYAEGTSHKPEQEIDTNYTMFDLSIQMIDVELSFMRWLDGKFSACVFMSREHV